MKTKIKYVIICIYSLIASSSLISAIDLEDIYRDSIINDVSLSVPSEYSTVQEALLYLDDKHISSGVTVTVQIEDGTYTNYDTINITHHQGDRIQIIGNIGNPTQVVIVSKPNQYAILCDNGNRISLIDGFTLQGKGTGIGIGSGRNSFIGVGSNVIVDGFDDCIHCFWDSMIQGKGMTIRNATGYGVLAHASTVDIDSATIDNCSNCGIFAGSLAFVQIRQGVCKNNNIGIRSWRNSYVDRTGMTYMNNNQNEAIASGGLIGSD